MGDAKMIQFLNDEAERLPFSRKVKLSEIENGVGKTIEATEEERELIKALLDLVALDRLVFSYKLRDERQGRVQVSGRLEAHVTQACVVSLEPVPAEVDSPVEVEFWPRSQVEKLARQAEDPDYAGEIEWPETIDADAIDLGPLIYETLATALDPYPKKAGAKMAWQEGHSRVEMAENRPFAVLKNLKKS